MSTHNICLHNKIRKNVYQDSPCLSQKQTVPLSGLWQSPVHFFRILHHSWQEGVQISIFFLFLHGSIMLLYSWEFPHWGSSNDYRQHIFLWWNKKNMHFFFFFFFYWRKQLIRGTMYQVCKVFQSVIKPRIYARLQNLNIKYIKFHSYMNVLNVLSMVDNILLKAL